MKIRLADCFALGLILLATQGCDTITRPTNTENALPANSLEPAPKISSAKPSPKSDIVFDVPALVGLTITQIKSKLGKPASDEQNNASGTAHNCVYKRGDYNLVIDYYVSSGKVSQFFINSTDVLKSYAHLLRASNLGSASAKYYVKASEGPTTERNPGVLVTTEPDSE